MMGMSTDHSIVAKVMPFKQLSGERRVFAWRRRPSGPAQRNIWPCGTLYKLTSGHVI